MKTSFPAYFLILLQLLCLGFVHSFSGSKNRIIHQSICNFARKGHQLFCANKQGDTPTSQPQLDSTFKKYECVSCAYVYDEALG